MQSIILDADGVLVNWSSSFMEFMINKGYPQKIFSSYAISSTFGITNELALKLGQEFNESDSLQSLSAIDGAVSGINYLYNWGFNLIVVTSVGDSEKIKNSRIKNLEGLFGKNTFKEIICLPFGGDKTEVLSRWKDTGFYFIEDKLENAKVGYDLGLKPVLLDYPYNKYFLRDQYATIKRAKNWQNICSFITIK